MTTKRKQILKAMAFSSCTIMDDLVITTGLVRKNLQDNVKATMKEGLCERIRDDVTGLPAYRLTTKGRAWLENDKDDSKTQQPRNPRHLKNDSVKPQPAVGKNTGSKDTGSIVDGGDLRADPLHVGNAVSAPPKPDKEPVAACADEIEQIHTDYKFAMYMIRKALCIDHDEDIGIVPTIESLIESNNDLRTTVDLLYAAAPTPTEKETRYIIAEEYLMADSEEEANAIALEIAKGIEIDNPVIVFSSHKARELRINWRDA